jgi:hypothetical protein
MAAYRDGNLHIKRYLHRVASFSNDTRINEDVDVCRSLAPTDLDKIDIVEQWTVPGETLKIGTLDRESCMELRCTASP